MKIALIVLALIVFLILFYVAGRLEFWVGKRGFDVMRRSRGDVRFGYRDDDHDEQENR